MFLFTSKGRDYISGLRSPEGILFFPHMIYEYVESRWNDFDRAKPKNSKKNLAECHSVHHKCTWNSPDANSGLYGERPTTNCLSFDMAISFHLLHCKRVFQSHNMSEVGKKVRSPLRSDNFSSDVDHHGLYLTGRRLQQDSRWGNVSPCRKVSPTTQLAVTYKTVIADACSPSTRQLSTLSWLMALLSVLLKDLLKWQRFCIQLKRNCFVTLKLSSWQTNTLACKGL
jgi:hypothetical protein